LSGGDGIRCFFLSGFKNSSGFRKRNLEIRVNVNCLIVAEQFAGWGKDGNWGDLTFMFESDPVIDKIAVVAKKQNKDELLMFLGAGRRQAEVRYFPSGEVDKAQNWLAASAD
jgi:hypothetical protein